jgi:hypothetical protein
LFRAVVRDTVAPNVEAIRAGLTQVDLPFAEIIRLFLPRFAEITGRIPVGAVAKMVIGESRNFPELAKVWHDHVASRAIGMIAELIAKAQAKGEVRPGDPRLHAFTLMGPMLMGLLWRETLQPVGGAALDIEALAAQHAESVLAGLLTDQVR